MKIITLLLVGILAIFRPSAKDDESSLGFKIALALIFAAVILGLYFSVRYFFQN